MKVAVIGAGAIGCITGAMLHECGHDVTLVCRREQAAAINSGGLVLDGITSRTYAIPAMESLCFRPDAVILAVKTQDIEDTAKSIKQHTDGSIIVTMQNGVKSDELAAGILGRDHIVSTVVMFGSTYRKPGHVTYNFPGGLVIGNAFENGRQGLVEEANALFDKAFEISISDDIHGAHRTKLILNLNNALAGILGTTLQETFSDERTCGLGVMLMREAYDVMGTAGMGLSTLPDLPVERLKSLLFAPPEVSADVYGKIMSGLSATPLPGSILQSIRRGRNSEVDYLNGEIAVLGLLHRHPAPLNIKAVKLVKEVEKTGRFMDRDTLFKEMDI